ncbi:non-ribosomal peptide synthetase [Streptomyces ziwulingensis]|uniref:Carrier domain-containing protein n=1 Tax=Streptomyces ziwulingensis TaxID=1045501 RepID=A0ABP9CEH5_9ACTN
MYAPGAHHDRNPTVPEVEPRPAVLPEAAPPPPRTLLGILRETVSAHPGQAAVDDGTRRLTYRELSAEVEAGAQRLRTLGIGVGDRVGIRIPSGTARLYVAILSVLAAGAAYVPVEADDPPARAERVWTEAQVCAVLEAGGTTRLREGTPPRSVTGVPGPDDDAWVIFTSGTSGRPKGVAISHRAAAAFVDAEARVFLPTAPLGPGDRVLAALSVAFDASCEEMWLAWRHGACLVPAPRVLVRSGADIAPWLRERRVTVVSTVPTLAEQWPDAAYAGVRLLIVGGETCPSALARRLVAGVAAGGEVWNIYGPTEATVGCSAARLTAEDTVRIGLPLDGWRLAVVDASLQRVGWGETGELVIGGVGLGRYLDPVLDAERFAPAQGWPRAYRTGDLVRAEEAGLVYVGRADDQVKIRGHRIEPEEIAALLTAHPLVRQAHVRAFDDGDGPYLVAYAVTGSQNTTELRSYLAANLATAMRPRSIVPLAALPLLGSGKLDLAGLPAPAPQTPVRIAPREDLPDAPAAVEEIVTATWCEVLNVAHVDRDENFFDIGGHSMLLIKVQRRLSERFNRRIPAVDLFAYPTVRTMTTYLSKG